MKTIYSKNHILRNSKTELYGGELVKPFERPERMDYILSEIKSSDENLFIKVRSTGRLIRSKVILKNKKAEVELLERETGISPGQACVFYSKTKLGDKVLGGGWIANTTNNYLST